MPCTLKDIAAEAGVSTATVSLVLNNRECRISDKTRKAIWAIAKQNNYVPNASARALVMRQSQTLGLIIPNIDNPYFSELAKGVEKEAQKLDYSVIFCTSGGNARKDILNFKLLTSRQIDGLILVTSIGDQDADHANEFNRLASESGIPIVQFDRAVPGGSYDSISVDHRLGGYLATRFLVQQGYRRIACAAGPVNVPTAQERYHGYTQALEEAGLALRPEWVTHGEYAFDTGVEAAQTLLDESIDAVFAANDMIACGFIRAMRERGMVVGKDIAVVGFDNIPLSEYLDTPLTTVAQPLYEMGKSACSMLIKACIATRRTHSVHQSLCFSPRLVIRETAPKRLAPALRGEGVFRSPAG